MSPGLDLRQGDCLDVLPTLPSDSFDCCVTSPPYWGLRDYSTATWEGGDPACNHVQSTHPQSLAALSDRCAPRKNPRNPNRHDDDRINTILYRGTCGKCGATRADRQIGLEGSMQEYVDKMVRVFREVRRVLKDGGTLWLNLGDSYARSGGESGGGNREMIHMEGAQLRMCKIPDKSGLKPKDLCGIPWRVAFALQQPYYTGNVTNERDRVWLAAMVDAEGSICGTEYQTGDRTKTNIYICITNTSVPIIDKCERLFPQDVKHVYEKTSGASNRRCFRWDVERMDTKAMFIREIYPYLVAKRKQAILGYTFIEMQRGLVSKKKGYLAEQHEQRSWLMDALSKLNNGEDVDLPDWVIEPPSLFEPGFYLRQDIIWAKPNPMPESVTDRCTKAHEYLFLLSKSQSYYFDQEAIMEPANYPEGPGNVTQKGQTAYANGDEHMRTKGGMNEIGPRATRNKRSVWTVATAPYKEAHFATFPPDLIKPCILAGSPTGGHVLDPFGGSGTTALVAIELARNATLIELSNTYCQLIRDRTNVTPGLAL